MFALLLYGVLLNPEYLVIPVQKTLAGVQFNPCSYEQARRNTKRRNKDVLHDSSFRFGLFAIKGAAKSANITTRQPRPYARPPTPGQTGSSAYRTNLQPNMQ